MTRTRFNKAMTWLVVLAALVGMSSASPAAAEDRAKATKFAGRTDENLRVQFDLAKGKLDQIYYELRFNGGCQQGLVRWFPDDPSRPGAIGGYGPAKVKSDGTFVFRGTGGDLLMKGRFVSNQKVKGVVRGAVICNNKPYWQKATFTAAQKAG